MSTSEKHKAFVAEEMGQKPVSDLAGIGPVLGQRLSEKGFELARIVLGQWLMLREDEILFCQWLKDTCNANKHQSMSCHNCLKAWAENFIG